MPASCPPSRRRQRSAREAGLRPSARWWWAAAWIGVVVCTVELALAGAGLGPEGALAGMLKWALRPGSEPTRAFAELDWGRLRQGSLALAAGLSVLGGGAALAARARQRRARRSLGPLGESGVGMGLGRAIDELDPGLAALGTVVGLAVVALCLRPALAGAARSVDSSAEGLALLWVMWGRRALWTAAGLALGLGGLERLASARRLWQGLHLTPAQVREQARVQGRR